jgi:hypothetical protein
MNPGSVVARSKARVLAILTVGAGVIGALAVATVLLVGAIAHLNPFATVRTQHPNAVVLAQLHDLARFDAASGRFQTIIDQSDDSRALPSWAYGERVTMVAEGDVAASVDLSHLPKGAIKLSADGRHAEVDLPAPTLGAPRLDPTSTRVIDRQRGVINRVGDALGSGDPVAQDQLEQQASDKLSAAAAQSDLRRRAEENTRSFIEGTLHAAGVKDVTVHFATDPA